MVDSTPSPGTFDLKLYEGKTYRRTVTWTIDGEEVDLSDATVVATIRPDFKSGTVLLALTEGAGITVDGPAGQITFEIDQGQAALGLDRGAWDLSARFPNQDDIAILRGAVICRGTSTR